MKWTVKDLRTLRKLYPKTPTRELAEKLGRSDRAVYQMARIQGLSKSPEYRREQAKRTKAPEATRFTEGHKPWNKGIQWDAGGRSPETRFKPGHRPQTWQPVGTEVERADGYIKVKVSDTRSKSDWKLKHVAVWEEHNGPLPEGQIVVFKNRDTRDFRPENLEAITRGENMRRNAYYNRYPPEVAQLIQLRGALNRQIRERAGQ